MTTNDSSSTTNQWLHKATAALEAVEITTARLDCLVLLEDTLQKDRSWILAHPEETISPRNLKVLDTQVARRAKHEPLAYVRGKTEFYGREFAVSAHTLEPRPETEDMVDLAKPIIKRYRDQPIIDVGTGSGAIGITLALETGASNIDLTDIDPEALKIAMGNVAKHGLQLKCHYADLLHDSPRAYFMVLANLPYVPDSHTINPAAMQEPKHAIFGGPDGLELYRQLFCGSNHGPDGQQSVPKYILTESLPFQHAALEEIANQYGYALQETRGFIQLFELI